jgi:peptidoglycan/xylan/chitin deacetylase (PgdA/CDA1 family)
MNPLSWFRPPRTVTLAIDDGPTEVTTQLIAQLEQAGHRAVLFVLGCNVAGREAILVDAVRRGFALGNHSFDHPHFSTLGLDQARAEILATEAFIETAYREAGMARHGRWFRFPYLDTGEQGAPAMQGLLRELGFRRPRAVSRRVAAYDRQRLDWPTTLDTRDWALPGEEAVRAALRRTRPGDVIEFHDKVETVGAYAAILVEELAALSLRAVAPQRGFEVRP